MALTRRNLRHLEDKIEAQTRTAFALLNNSLVYEGTNKPLDGTALYVHLFGSTAPITISTITTPEIVSIFKEMEGGNPNRSPESTQVESLISIPATQKRSSCLRIPLTSNSSEYNFSPFLILPCFEPVLRLRYWCDDPIPGPMVHMLRIHLCTTPLLVSKMREAVDHIYGRYTTDTIERILTIRTRLDKIEERVVRYASTSVASWGSLYKKLPPLFTLYPNNTIHHVSLTRGAKDPEPSLLEDLNLLAALIAAAPKS